MASVNKVILIGHLGKDPELRYTTSGRAVAHVTVATTDSWKDKNTGEKQERTEWHYVVFYSPLAEIAGQYLRKGASVFVEGRLQTRKWQDKNGQDRTTTEIIAQDLKMLGRRPESTGADNGPATYPTPAYPAPARSGETAPPREPAIASGGGNDDEDDIPF